LSVTLQYRFASKSCLGKSTDARIIKTEVLQMQLNFEVILLLTSMETLSLVKPLFLLSKCLGLAPFAMTGTGGSSGSLRVSRAAVVYSFGMLASISAFLIQKISFRNDFHMSSWPVSVANVVFQLSTTLFTYWACCISCTINYSNMIEVMHQMFMSALSRSTLPRRYRLFRSILALQMFGGLLTFGVLYYIEWYYDLYSGYREMIPYIIIDCCDYIYELQFIDIVLLLGYYFDNIGTRITKLCEENEEHNSVKRNTLVPISHYGISYEMNSKTLFRAKIQELIRLHFSLCDTAEIVNSIYSFMMLINSAGALVGITYGLYITSITIFDRINVYDREVNPLLPTLSWSFFYVTMLVCVVSSCSSTRHKVRKMLTFTILRSECLRSLCWQT
jgi:hypothetical protein